MADAATTAPLAFIADRAHRVPRVSNPDYLDAVIKICAENSIRLVVPTIDPELPVYAAAQASFRSVGAVVSISGPETIAICGDKIATHDWLTANNFPTVRQTTVAKAVSDRWPLPFIAKPRHGSASAGITRIGTLQELYALAERATCAEPAAGDSIIIQEIAEGREFTINVYVNRTGRCICAVPHWRIETRAGEVSKGVTVRDMSLIGLARSVAQALPNAWGPLNIQCFMNSAGDIKIIEVNARFGGGYPLAYHSGARFTDWLLDEISGRTPLDFDDWTADLAMLRYDEAIYLPASQLR